MKYSSRIRGQITSIPYTSGTEAPVSSELLQLLLARLAERLVRPLLQKGQCDRFMNRWPRTTLQKQREQHNANRAYHLATQRKDHEFPARDSQGRHIGIFFASRWSKA